MGLFDFVRRDPTEYTAPRGVPSPDEAHDLALYKFDGCPYCQRVLRVLKGLSVEVELRDTMRDAAHRHGLLEKTGRTQVPCLFIGEYALFESDDISRWLEAYAVRGGVAG